MMDHKEAEIQKCIDSPVYFYNNYCKQPNQEELTEEEYNDFLKVLEYHEKMGVPLKLRSHYDGRRYVYNTKTDIK